MTRINIQTDIPVSAQQSLEALTTWCLTVLANLYPDVIDIEGTNTDNSPIWVRSVTINPLLNTAKSISPDTVPAPGTIVKALTPSERRFLARFSCLLNTNYQSANGTYWNSVTEFGTDAIPANFKPPIAT